MQCDAGYSEKEINLSGTMGMNDKSEEDDIVSLGKKRVCSDCVGEAFFLGTSLKPMALMATVRDGQRLSGHHGARSASRSAAT